MKSTFHATVGTVALLCITSFWLATFVSEVLLDTTSVIAVKNAILTAMWLLIPSMLATGASGFALARGRKGRLLEVKKRRMQVAAANGLLILLPCAITLASMASAGQFDLWFYSIQGVELVAGAINIVLLALNMRDGLRMRAMPRSSPAT